jgi:L-iditol 2-dehydrogenase
VADIQKVPEGLDIEIACLAEPLCVPMYGIYRSGIQPGDTVAVFGLGINGQISVQGARLRGATTVIAVDCFEGKLDLAQKLGNADYVLNMETMDILGAIDEITKSKGVDVVMETSGYGHPKYEEMIRLETESTRHNGIYVMIGWPTYPVTVDMHRWHHHGLDIRVVALRHHSREWEAPIIERVLRPYQQGLMKLEGLITGRFPLSKIAEAFSDLDDNSDHVKVAVMP